jgi:hypothetical protein
VLHPPYTPFPQLPPDQAWQERKRSPGWEPHLGPRSLPWGEGRQERGGVTPLPEHWATLLGNTRWLVLSSVGVGEGPRDCKTQLQLGGTGTLSVHQKAQIRTHAHGHTHTEKPSTVCLLSSLYSLISKPPLLDKNQTPNILKAWTMRVYACH